MKLGGRWGSAAKQPPHRPDSARAVGLHARLVVLPLYSGPTLCGRRFPMTDRSWIHKLFARPPRRAPHGGRPAPPRSRPTLDVLEDRLTPTTLGTTALLE